jgi:hypothetical protein
LVVTLNALTFVSEFGEQGGSSGQTLGCASRRFPDSRGALSSEPRVSRNAVEASRRGCLVRVGTQSRHPVERASYESERGRGFPSSVPRTSRYAVEVSLLLFWLVSFVDSGFVFLNR